MDGSTRALRMVARGVVGQAVDLDARSGHPASLHPAAGHWTEAGGLTDRLVLGPGSWPHGARGSGSVAA